MDALLYLGCTVPVRNLNYEVSARLTARALGIHFHDLDSFGCCGFPLKSLNAMDTLVIAARNLALAESQGMEVCALCNACAATLTEAVLSLELDSELKAAVNDKLSTVGLVYKGPVRVRHYMRLLWEEIGPERLKEKIVKPLTGAILAPHYGCHYLKPSELTEGFDSPDVPHTLTELIKATGASILEYATLKDCCGGGLLGLAEDLANSLATKKLEEISLCGAHALVLVCPFCNVMYEGQQKKIAKQTGLDLKVPVVYYPQVLGLALGFSPEELGFRLNRIKPTELLRIADQ